MKKRILCLDFVLVFIFSFISYSCKHNNSTTSNLVEQTADGICSYIYSTYAIDEENYRYPLYCITKCKKCPDNKIIQAINTPQDQKKILDEYCPLQGGKTVSLIPKEPTGLNWMDTYINKDKKLELKTLPPEQLPILKNTNVLSLFTLDENYESVSKKCLRESDSDSGTIIQQKIDEANAKASNQYNIMICPRNNSKPEIFMVHMQEDNKTIDYVYKIDKLNEKNTFNDIENIPDGYRLPTVDECIDEKPDNLVRGFIMYRSIIFNEPFDPQEDNDPVVTDRFWIQNQNATYQNKEQGACRILNSLKGYPVNSQKTTHFKYLLLIQNPPSINNCFIIPPSKFNVVDILEILSQTDSD